MSESLRALYAGDAARARELLPADDELSVFEAAAFGRLEALARLLAEDADRARAYSPDGFTALHLAVFAEQDDAARLLLERGADPNALSTGSIARVPPLGTAAFVRSTRLAGTLLDGGADVNRQGAGGFTALHTAAANGDEELIQLLLERGADPDAANGEGTRPAELASDERIRLLLARP